MQQTQEKRQLGHKVTIRLLKRDELGEADKIVRLAFGTFLRVPDPMQVFGDKQLLTNRWIVDPEAVFAAELDGELVGTNVASKWGSFGFFGPLTVKPEYWDSGIAQKLLEPAMSLFDKWGVTHAGLFTFPESTKHVSLYHKFGFHARFLTPIMVKSLGGKEITNHKQFVKFSSLDTREGERALGECKELANEIYEGLDLSSEIRSVENQRLGDTLLLYDNSKKLSAFAVCHIGAKTEAGSENCYVKFGAGRSNKQSIQNFSDLLNMIESFAAQSEAKTIEAGVNLSNPGEYDIAYANGFRPAFNGIAMHKPNAPGFCREDIYALSDWR